jgi:hypothetical protein
MLLLWAISLVLPAIRYCAATADTVPHETWDHGLKLLLFGWLGPFEGLFGWFANPCLLLLPVALVPGERPWPWLSCAPLLFALIAWGQGDFERGFDAGSYTACGFGPGYWVWLAACTIPAILCVADWRVSRRDKPLPD